MRWFAIVAMLISFGCSYFAGGITGRWSSSNGLEVEIQQDRSWRGNFPIGMALVTFTGQWNLENDILTLNPAHFTVKPAFSGMRMSGRDRNDMNRDARMAVEMMRNKSFTLTKEGSYDVLKDTSPSGDQSMYRVED